MAANAASMRPRVDVPGGLVTSGTDARSAVVSRRRPASGESGGSTTISSCSVSSLLTSPGSATGSSVSPISERPLRTSVATAAASSGWSTRTTTSGWAWRNGADEGRERVDRQRGQRHQVERSGGEPADRRDRRAQDPEIAQHLPGRFEERLARRRQEGAPPDPVEQLEAQLGLETADPLRQRRLRDVEGVGGSGEAALLDDPDHVLDLADLHRSSL